jgi:hypothetical protein
MRSCKLPVQLASLVLLLLALGCTHGNSSKESTSAIKQNALNERTSALAKQSQADSVAIIGTWLSGSGHWKLVFSQDYKCRQYMDTVLIETDSVVIANTSPQCGITVPVDNYTSYLRLINVSDTTQNLCYDLNSVTDSTLSITNVGHGGVITFRRQ